MRALLVCIATILCASTAISQAILGSEFNPEDTLKMCRTSIQGKKEFVVFNNEEDMLFENYSFREKIFGGSKTIDCPAFVTLRLLTPELTDVEREPFCLSYEKRKDTYTGFAQGARDAYLLCKTPSKPLCERVNDSKDAAIALVGLGSGASAGTAATLAAGGLSVVPHSSGAMILTGSSGYIGGTLGSLGTTIASVLSAPVTLTAAVVSVVAVGGAIYVCAPEK